MSDDGTTPAAGPGTPSTQSSHDLPGPEPGPPTEADPALAALDRVRRKGKVATTRKRRSRGQVPMGGDREPRLLGEIVSQLAESRAWTADLEVGTIVGRWGELVGPDVAEHCQPESFDEGKLTLRADSTAWAHQLRLLIPQLRARLEAAAGSGVIGEIEIRGPAAPSWKHGRRTVAGRGPRDTYG